MGTGSWMLMLMLLLLLFVVVVVVVESTEFKKAWAEGAEGLGPH